MATRPDDQPSATEITFAPFRWSFRMGMSLFVMWVTAVLIQIAHVRYQRLDPAQHIQFLIGAQVDRSASSAVASGRGFVEKATDHAFYWVFEAVPTLKSLAAPPPRRSSESFGIALQRGGGLALRQDYVTASYTTVLFVSKLALLATLLPVFAVLLIVAGIDGLVARYVRTACGGNESASIYHRAKMLGVNYLPALVGVIYLAMPVDFNPYFFLGVSGLLSAILLRLQVKYYKKYL